MATYEPERTRNFYLLGDSQAEMVRLIATGELFTKAMGGLLPEQPEQAIAHLRDVLDIGCGPGGWVLEMAYANPGMHATGIDISQGMIDYANALARANGLDNTEFHVANAIDPLGFPDASFDLVNVRQLEAVIPDERMCGATVLLSRYLRDAGCVNIQERPSIMDFSAGEEYCQAMTHQFLIVSEVVEPFLLGTKVTTKPELERLRHQFSIEMLEDSFRGILYMLTAWGEKP